MYGSKYDDDECTADVGPMGQRGCHKYPGCGCDKSYERESSQDERVDFPDFRLPLLPKSASSITLEDTLESPPLWPSREGLIKISEMSDEHLANSFALCVRKEGLQHPRTKSILIELIKRFMLE